MQFARIYFHIMTILFSLSLVFNPIFFGEKFKQSTEYSILIIGLIIITFLCMGFAWTFDALIEIRNKIGEK